VRLSVKQITVAAIVLLTLSTSIAVSGLVWSSNLLQRTSAALVQAAEALRLARDIEQELFSHQRSAILAASTPDETLQNEQAIVNQLRAAQRNASNSAQAALLNTLADQISTYFDYHATYSQRGNAIEAFTAVRPAFDRAVRTVVELTRSSELELQRGNATAQRLGSLFRLTALVAAILALALMMLMSFTVRRMILAPILQIRDVLERFRSGDYGVQADENIPRELGEIAAAFNDMKAELARRRDDRVAFFGGVAHDLRNPLSALKAGVTALEMDPSNATRVQQTLRILYRQLDHLERMCGDLLELSKMEAGKLELSMESFDLRDAVVAVTDLYRPIASGRQFALEFDSEAVVVTADRIRIEQVIGNLVKNAIKYSGQDALISLEVTRRDDAAVIEISDNGVGIPHDELESIFRPFLHGSGTPSSGAGLGLSIVQRIVAAHGGTVSVVSAVGTGSTFTVRLPR
jgi:signal transduction histidine kinase